MYKLNITGYMIHPTREREQIKRADAVGTACTVKVWPNCGPTLDNHQSQFRAGWKDLIMYKVWATNHPC